MKTAFIVLTTLTIVPGVLYAFAFISFNAIVKSTLSRKKVPERFRNYPCVDEGTGNQDDSRMISYRNIKDTIYFDNGGNLIICEQFTPADSSVPDHYLHRIGKDGQVIETIKMPEGVDFNKNLVGPDCYCNWINDGDATVYRHEFIYGMLNTGKFMEYHQLADEVYFFDNNRVVLHMAGKWYTTQISSVARKLKEKIENPPISMRDGVCPLANFEYYERTRHITRHIPLKDGNTDSHWDGYGYLKLPESGFCFKTYMREYDGGRYESRISVYENKHLVVIRDIDQHSVRILSLPGNN